MIPIAENLRSHPETRVKYLVCDHLVPMQKEPLTNEKACQILVDVHEKLFKNELNFQYKEIKTPPSGSIILFFNPWGQLLSAAPFLPPDGYLWRQSDSQTHKLFKPELNTELGVTISDKGLGTINGIILKAKKYRFFFTDPKYQIHILQYVSPDLQLSSPAGGLGTSPRKPLPSSQTAVQNSTSKASAGSAAATPISHTSPKPSSSKKKKKKAGEQDSPAKPQAQVQTAQIQGPPPPVTIQSQAPRDILDSFTERDVALIRYKRSFDMMNEIFSTFKADKVLLENPPKPSAVDEEQLQARIDDSMMQKQIMESKLLSDSESYRQQLQEIQYYMDRIDSCKSVEEVEKIEREFENKHHVRFHPYEVVKAVPLNGFS